MSNIILCGFQYAGKTTLGQYLADKLHQSFIDTDDLIAQVYFKIHNLQTARNIYHALGEQNFRELECDVIQGLGNTQNSIIALGGGSLIHPENRNLLRKLGTLIYLNWPVEILKSRVLAKGVGAFLDSGNFDESFRQAYIKRHEIFLQHAHHKIELTNETVEQTAHKILALL